MSTMQMTFPNGLRFRSQWSPEAPLPSYMSYILTEMSGAERMVCALIVYESCSRPDFQPDESAKSPDDPSGK